MNKKSFLALFLIVLSICFPAGGLFYFFYQQAREQEINELASLAKRIALRASDTRTQMVDAFNELKQHGVRCDPKGFAKMQSVSVNAAYLQAVGVFQDGKIICSSFGNIVDGWDLGKGQGRTATGIQAWVNVNLPISDKHKFNVYEKDGYVTLVHPGQVVDVHARNDISLAVLVSNPKFIARSKGHISSEWISAYQPNQSETQIIGSNLVSFYAVPEHNIAGLAASNKAVIWERLSSIAIYIITLSLLASLFLTSGVVMLSRHQAGPKKRLLDGLKKKEFFLHFQPIFDITTGQCVSAEALIRWRRPDGSIDEPLLFIPSMEKYGLMPAMTKFVMREAAETMRPLLKRHPTFRLSINFSPADLVKDCPLKAIQEMLNEMGAHACNLIIEITERSYLDTEKTRDIISEIRKTGVSIMIDDFGTGYSNLATLHSIQVDGLKMDRIFTESVDTTAATHNVANSIIQMAHNLGLGLVAEGVETTAQLAFLKAHGVKYAQGFLLGKPMSAEDLLSLLNTQVSSQTGSAINR